MGRSTYNTRQRQQVKDCLARHSDSFLTVDGLCSRLAEEGTQVGRTTVYRTLESLAAEDEATKVAAARGGSARYRLRPMTLSEQGQLSCTRCGKVFPLDCSMLQEFSAHVEEHHGFAIDQRKTVLYGLCASCRAAEEEGAAR